MPIVERTSPLQVHIPILFNDANDWFQKNNPDPTVTYAYAPTRALDGRINGVGTRVDQEHLNDWMIFELASVSQIRDIFILWYKGYERKYRFKMEISEDKTNWIKIFDGESQARKDGAYDDYVFANATTVDPFLIPTIKGQYLRLTNIGGAKSLAGVKVTDHFTFTDIFVMGHMTNEIYAYIRT